MLVAAVVITFLHGSGSGSVSEQSEIMPKVLAASPPRGVGGNEIDHIDRACGTLPRTLNSINAKVSRLKFSSHARLALTTEVSTKSLSRIPFRRLVT